MLAALTLGLSLLLVPPKPVVVVVVSPPKGGLTVLLQPSGRADIKRDATLTRINVEIEKLQMPSKYGPGLNSYVLWAVSPEGDVENIGELAMDKDKGRLETTTRYDQVGLLVTAEPHYMVDRPSAAVAFRSQGPRSEQVRQLSVSVDVGTYDYSKFVRQEQEVPVAPLVAEARTALQIAKDADAERWAESDFRAARAALDTMEQLVSRASPLDIVAESANETIRRSQRAVTIARQKGTKPPGNR